MQAHMERQGRCSKITKHSGIYQTHTAKAAFHLRVYAHTHLIPTLSDPVYRPL